MKYLAAVLATFAAASCSPASDEEALGGMEMSVEEAGVMAKADARDGPFGFEMGQSIRDVVGAEKIDAPGLYRVNSPPKSHSDFEAIILEAYPDTGICKIRGIGRDLLGDGAGASIRGKVDDLAKALETKYGAPRKSDRCIADRIKCDPSFWMMTLDDNERVYAYLWESQSEGMKAANIGEIAVGAAATNIQDSYPILEFYSADASACEAARNSSSADAL